MHTPFLRCTLLSAAIGGLLASPAQASEWNGSYIANGQCFCSGVVDSSVRNQLVPTPIGGQSVDQICDRIGDGPKLVKTDGTFNFPVYDDPQCGHGPFSAGSTIDASCSGAYEPGIDCQSAGPNWNLPALYEQASTEQKIETVTAAVTGGSRYIDPSLFKATDDATTDDATEVVSEADEFAEERFMIIDGVLVAVDESESERQARVAAERVTANEKAAAAAERANHEAQLLAEQQQALDAERQIAWQKAAQPAVTAEPTVTAKDQSLQDEQQKTAAAAVARTQSEVNAKLARAAEEARLAEITRAADEARLAEFARIDEEAKLAEQARIASDAKLAAKDAAAIEETAKTRSAEIVAETSNDSSPITPMAALQLPAGVRTNYNDFEYIQALPMGYDYGGGGMAVTASYSSHGKWHYLGRAGVANSYNELFVGAGYYLTPPTATRMTVVATAGLEYGRFELTANEIQTPDSDTGLALSIASRLVINRYMELEGGVGYSSFFDGDIHFLGGGFVHINKQLDLTSQFEIGDNDSFGLGIRYYY